MERIRPSADVSTVFSAERADRRVEFVLPWYSRNGFCSPWKCVTRAAIPDTAAACATSEMGDAAGPVAAAGGGGPSTSGWIGAAVAIVLDLSRRLTRPCK